MMNGEESFNELLKNMSLEEKASLMSGSSFWLTEGVKRLGIPPIRVADGPHGLRKQPEGGDHLGIGGSIPSTCFPTAVTTASSWDVSLLHRIGEALGEECLQEKVSVVLGPGVNIKRSPLCGRNFEYFSEDPLLAGEMSAAFINGVQSKGVGTSLKHFAANNQEYFRFIIDTIVDDRALREIYLRPFEIAVKKSQPWTLMCSYNRINGKYSSDNKWLLTDVLKNEWKHEGIVVTDWGACNNRVEGIKAGLELEMPGSGGINDRMIVKAVRDGKLDEADLDRCVLRMLDFINKASGVLEQHSSYDVNAHHDLAREAAEESMVMLKNESVLPLDKEANFCVIGDMAVKYRYQGAGSSQIVPTRLSNPFKELCLVCGREVAYSKGYDSSTDKTDRKLIDQALAVSDKTETVIVFAGLPNIFESEGFDRDHMRLPDNQNELIEELIRAGKKVIVVLSNGAPVELPWLNECHGLIEMYLGGQAGSEAIAKIIFGEVNPSGKLAETFPLKLEDTPCYSYFPGNPQQVEYRESLYVGYRYYNSMDKPVAFPFGFGLSYTQFEYSDIKLSSSEIGDDQNLSVVCNIKNIGNIAGKEVVQLYINDLESSFFRPAMELQGFTKVFLNPGESKQIEFELARDNFAFFDTATKTRQVEPGLFTVMIGASSRDIRLKADVNVVSGYKPVVDESLRSFMDPYYRSEKPRGVFEVNDAAFEALLGNTIPPVQKTRRPFHRNSALGHIRETWMGRRLWKIIAREFMNQMSVSDDETVNLMARRMLDEMPLRALVLLSGGVFTDKKLKACLDLLNGRLVRGLLGMIRN